MSAILDNFESLLEPGEHEGQYRPAYGAYRMLLQVVGQSAHPSCVLLTSREAPPDLAQISGGRGNARVLELGGLQASDAPVLLSDKSLIGDIGAWQALVKLYDGNPLALKVVGETIRQLFAGDIASFLEQAASSTVFGDVRRLVQSQIERLSPIEQDILDVLAIEREPTGFIEVVKSLGRGMRNSVVLEALESLRRRSLVEPGPSGASFMLRSVVLEYVTDRLIERASDEFQHGGFDLLRRRPLVKSQAPDYVRHAQERLIAEPILERLAIKTGGKGPAARMLNTSLQRLRMDSSEPQGFGPGNALNLLRLLLGNLRGLDLSGLDIRQAYLVRVWEAEAGELLATLSGHVGGVWGVALNDDGTLVASATFDGLVKLWAVPSGELIRTLRGHTGPVWTVAFTHDHTLLASGSFDGTLRLWNVHSGEPLRVIRPDRRYERTDITGLSGITEAQREALLALGAVEHSLTPAD